MSLSGNWLHYFVSYTLPFIVFGFIGRWYLWPALKNQPPRVALPPPLLYASCPVDGLMFFLPGVVTTQLPRAFANKLEFAAPAERVFRLPAGISFEDAAAIPLNYLTAHHIMFVMGNLQQGDRILVHGAAGGVGGAAVQLAKARDLEVFGTAGPAKQEFLRRSGVDHPIDYTREDFVEVVRRAAPEGVEMVMDPIGGKLFTKSYRCLGPMGRLAIYGFSSAAGPEGKPSLLRAAKAFLATRRYHPLKLMQENTAIIGVHLGHLDARGAVLAKELAEVFRLYSVGKIKPIIGKTFALEEAAAHRYIHNRQNVGKVVLRVA